MASAAELGYGRTKVKDNDDVKTYPVAGKWCMNKTLGFGLAYENTDWNGYEVNAFNVSSEWFVTESLALSLEYSYQNPDAIDVARDSRLEVDSDAFTIGAPYRF